MLPSPEMRSGQWDIPVRSGAAGKIQRWKERPCGTFCRKPKCPTYPHRISLPEFDQLQPLVVFERVGDMPLTGEEQKIIATEILYPFHVEQVQL